MHIGFVKQDVSDRSSLGCGGVVGKAFFPKNLTELAAIAAERSDETFVIAGGLTNTLVLSGADETFLFSDCFRGIRFEEDQVTVRVGEKTAHVADLARVYGLSGLENLCGIPGTIGGAVYGNAGAYGSSLSDLIESVSVFRLDDGETELLCREEIAFSYRHSSLRRNLDFVYEVGLRLYPDDSARIAARMEEARRKRKEKMPSQRSLGCVFKNPDEMGAGYYIEKSGLKGARAGGMQISEKHANVIVNTGGGTAEEYLELVNLAEKTVRKNFGIKLEKEICVYGERRQDR